MNNLSLINLTRGKFPRLPLGKLKEKILGKKYALSVVFVGDKRAKALNKKYRGRNYSPDVLAFPLSKNSGEIFIAPKAALRQAALFGENAGKYTARLFIHGLLHLKGYEHGSKMECEEESIKREFVL